MDTSSQKESHTIEGIEKICREEENRFLSRIDSPWGNDLRKNFNPSGWDHIPYIERIRRITEANVIELLGRPAWISDGTVSEYGHKRRPESIKEEVKKEYWFYCKYAPEVWNVSFDKEGRVVSTSHLLSP